jgi:hypothetical protein
MLSARGADTIRLRNLHFRPRIGLFSHFRPDYGVSHILGSGVIHRCNRYLNNRLEQDHRGIKQRYYPVRGFGNVESAARFCRAFDELRNYFRPRHTMWGKRCHWPNNGCSASDLQGCKHR